MSTAWLEKPRFC